MTSPASLPHDWEVAPCLDLVNSTWTDHRGSGVTYDRLGDPRFRRAFLTRWQLDVDHPRSEGRWSQLAQLRGLLRKVLECYAADQPLPTTLRRRLEAEMNRAPVWLEVDGQRRVGSQWAVAIAQIATSAARLMSERKTVKVCANPSCTWMFVDESRPGSRRWCNTFVCGSLINVRRFRAARARR